MKFKYVSTSFAERQNLTVRMHMRRFTGLTVEFVLVWAAIWTGLAPSLLGNRFSLLSKATATSHRHGSTGILPSLWSESLQLHWQWSKRRM
ncbi:hypothetical protein FJ954_11480 [Mesorhizobium sp. B2-3-15]|nr:hypothetical protein FJ954_11480 [Mesorhizobium sp. B2-3-15]TPL99547.1 hypothetical protein FJ943_13910 [Mesorhizobium sp. B2-3-10]